MGAFSLPLTILILVSGIWFIVQKPIKIHIIHENVFPEEPETGHIELQKVLDDAARQDEAISFIHQIMDLEEDIPNER